MASAYASVVGVFANSRNFKIQFREFDPVIDDEGKIVGQALAIDQLVTLAPETAKELSIILNGQIDSYEKQFGVIKTYLNVEQGKADANE